MQQKSVGMTVLLPYPLFNMFPICSKSVVSPPSAASFFLENVFDMSAGFDTMEGEYGNSIYVRMYGRKRVIG